MGSHQFRRILHSWPSSREQVGELDVINQDIFRTMSLGIVLPSNNPDAYFGRFSPSLSYLKEGLEQLALKICICAQPPWTEAALGEAKYEAMEQGIDLRAVLVDAESPPRMCFLRQQAASLFPNATVYMLADDNMSFARGQNTEEIPHTRTSGQCYAEVLDYMFHYARCGLVQCHTTAPVGVGRSIRPTSNGLITTNKGLFIRNLNRGFLWPQWSWKFLSSLEETVAGYSVLDQGYFPARQHQNPTLHTIHKIGDDDALHSHDLIYANAGRWVREFYNDPEWDHQSAYFPETLIDRAVGMAPTGSVSFVSSQKSFTRKYDDIA